MEILSLLVEIWVWMSSAAFWNSPSWDLAAFLLSILIPDRWISAKPLLSVVLASLSVAFAVSRTDLHTDAMLESVHRRGQR